MKKISTLLLACATVATASAAGFTFNNASPINDVKKFNTVVTLENAPLKADKARHNFYAKASMSRAGSDIEGNWVGMYYSDNSLYGLNSFNVKNVSGTDYTISGFWNQLAYEGVEHKAINATFDTQDVEFSDGTYEMEVLTIPGKGQSVIGTADGDDVVVLLGQLNGNQVKLYTNDIEYMYDDEYGSFWWPYQDGVGVAICIPADEANSYSIIDFYNITEIDYANATLVGDRMVDDAYESYSNAFLALDISENSTEDEFGCIGFAGLDGLPIYYIENGEAVFYAQTAGTVYSQGTAYDVLIVATPDGGDSVTQEVVGEVTEEDSKKIATFDNMIFFVADMPAIYMWLDNAVVTYGENAHAGISNVAADVDNSNAPVVYYNLQGQLVKEPAAGQIVIRKQGTEATKVLVK